MAYSIAKMCLRMRSGTVQLKNIGSYPFLTTKHSLMVRLLTSSFIFLLSLIIITFL